MPLSDLPLSTLVLFFLLIFVLIGLYPAWQRTAARIRKVLQSAEMSEGPLSGPLNRGHRAVTEEQPSSAPLNDFEIIVLRRVAQNGGKAFSRKQLNAELHLESAILQQTLKSLYRRGLVQLIVTPWFGQRYYLSEKGRAYALAQGFILEIHQSSGRF